MISSSQNRLLQVSNGGKIVNEPLDLIPKSYGEPNDQNAQTGQLRGYPRDENSTRANVAVMLLVHQATPPFHYQRFFGPPPCPCNLKCTNHHLATKWMLQAQN